MWLGTRQGVHLPVSQSMGCGGIVFQKVRSHPLESLLRRRYYSIFALICIYVKGNMEIGIIHIRMNIKENSVFFKIKI